MNVLIHLIYILYIPLPFNLKFLSLLHNLVIKSYNDLEKKCG